MHTIHWRPHGQTAPMPCLTIVSIVECLGRSAFMRASPRGASPLSEAFSRPAYTVEESDVPLAALWA